MKLWLDHTAWDKLYWSDVRERAIELESDGCTGVPQWLIWTCWEHDIHYRTHKMLDGTMIDKRTADYIFRVRIQQGSGFGVLSPVSWWRWIGVRMLAKRAWEHA
jgi:hypothetical protein